MAIQINPTVSPRIITVPETDGTSITVQSLVNQIREWEQNPLNLGYNRLLSASGKEVLDEGPPSVLVGITAKLENTKVKFADNIAPILCSISGGNLVAVDEYGNTMNVIEPSENVTVMLSQSSSATLTNNPSAQDNADAVWDSSAPSLTNLHNDIIDELTPALKNILGLVQHNFKFFEQTYDNKGKLTAGKIRIYNSAEDCDSNSSPINEYEIAATYDTNDRLKDYKVKLNEQ